jgi:hypothetical protein
MTIKLFLLPQERKNNNEGDGLHEETFQKVIKKVSVGHYENVT